MSQQIEADYSKQWLLPPSLEDLVGPDHPARMVREFVDAEDLKALGFKQRAGEEGRPRYSSGLLLKVWLYGYMTKTRSVRGLERACMDQMGMLWLTGMNYPDHTTLWRFFRDNKEPIGQVFKRLLQAAASMELVGLVLHAIDGTKILSQASPQQGLHRSVLEKKLEKLDEAIEEILKQTELTWDESVSCRLPEKLQRKELLRQQVQQQIELLNEKNREHLQVGDEDARVMKTREGNRFAYNAQAVVDEESKLIVAVDVVVDETDNYQLVSMLDQVQQNLGQVAEQTAADNGYNAISELAKAEEKGYPVLVHQNEASPNKPYDAQHFNYDSDKDQCICPRGEVLAYEFTRTRDKLQAYESRIYRCQSYENCPVRWQCSSSKTGRTIQIHSQYGALKRQREKLRDQRMRALLKKRSTTVEPVFGWAKQVMGFRRWTVRGVEKAKAHWTLLCTAMNMNRLYKAWTAGTLEFGR